MRNLSLILKIFKDDEDRLIPKAVIEKAILNLKQ
jgi:hypothetical protein